MPRDEPKRSYYRCQFYFIDQYMYMFIFLCKKFKNNYRSTNHMDCTTFYVIFLVF